MFTIQTWKFVNVKDTPFLILVEQTPNLPTITQLEEEEELDEGQCFPYFIFLVTNGIHN